MSASQIAEHSSAGILRTSGHFEVCFKTWPRTCRLLRLVRGPTALGPGSGSHGTGPWFGVSRRWALVRGPTALGPGSGSHGAGPWFGVPRRWTLVRGPTALNPSVFLFVETTSKIIDRLLQNQGPDIVESVLYLIGPYKQINSCRSLKKQCAKN